MRPDDVILAMTDGHDHDAMLGVLEATARGLRAVHGELTRTGRHGDAARMDAALREVEAVARACAIRGARGRA